MRSLTVLQEQSLASGSHRFAMLWKVERRDGVVLRFTDHDTDIIIPSDGTYTPTPKFDVSARERTASLSEANFEVRGILKSEVISEFDLRSGKYRNAKVTESVIDFACPENGSFETNVYWMSSFTYDGETWNASVVGVATWLVGSSGRNFNRTCDANLGDSRCKAAVAGTAGTVTSILDKRGAFRGTTSTITGYYSLGKFVWNSGNNVSTNNEVLKQQGGVFYLALRLPGDIQIGDSYTVFPGCNRTFDNCKNKFNNVVNFRGFNTIPGNDILTRSPSSKKHG